MLSTANYFPDDCDDACEWAVDGYGEAEYLEWCAGPAMYDTTACAACNAAMLPTCALDECEAALAAGSSAAYAAGRCDALDTGARANLHKGLLLFAALYAAARAWA